jgi:hypothetical protein
MGRAYTVAGPTVRRLLSQAFFRQLRIREDDVVEGRIIEAIVRVLSDRQEAVQAEKLLLVSPRRTSAILRSGSRDTRSTLS